MCAGISVETVSANVSGHISTQHFARLKPQSSVTVVSEQYAANALRTEHTFVRMLQQMSDSAPMIRSSYKCDGRTVWTRRCDLQDVWIVDGEVMFVHPDGEFDNAPPVNPSVDVVKGGGRDSGRFSALCP
jgi:hypothetical protein